MRKELLWPVADKFSSFTLAILFLHTLLSVTLVAVAAPLMVPGESYAIDLAFTMTVFWVVSMMLHQARTILDPALAKLWFRDGVTARASGRDTHELHLGVVLGFTISKFWKQMINRLTDSS